jgi:hypothetical protein
MHESIASTVKELRQIILPQLKRLNAEVFGKPTRSGNSQWMLRRIA